MPRLASSRRSTRDNTNDSQDRRHREHEADILNSCNEVFGHIAETEGYYQKFGKLMLRICSKTVIPTVSESRTRPNGPCPSVIDFRRRLITAYNPILIQRSQISIKNIDPTNVLPFMFNEWIKLKERPERQKSFFKRLTSEFFLIQNPLFGVGVDAGGVSRTLLNNLAEQIKDFCALGYPKKTGENENRIFKESVKDSNRYVFNPKFRLDQFEMQLPHGYTEQDMRTNAHLRDLRDGIIETGRNENPIHIDGFVGINQRLNSKYPNIEARTAELFKFIGAYYAFCILNDICIDIPLSRNILYGLYKTIGDLDQNKVITYYLLDNASKPGLARTIIKQEDSYMQTPDIYLPTNAEVAEAVQNGTDIEDTSGLAGMFNDFAEQHHHGEEPFHLIEEDNNKPVTVENLRDYIFRVAMYENFGRAVEEDTPLINFAQGFYEGFNIFGVKKTLSQLLRSKPIIVLDRLLSSYEIPTKPGRNVQMMYPAGYQPNQSEITTMRYFINFKLRFNSNNAAAHDIINWFREILFNYGSDYPVDTSIYAHPTDEIRTELFTEFFKKLIAFWSGNPKVMFNKNYIINLIDNRASGALPMSHTCFFTLDLPTNITSKEDLYRRLILAVFNSGGEIGNAGGAGGARSASTKKRHHHNTKSGHKKNKTSHKKNKN